MFHCFTVWLLLFIPFIMAPTVSELEDGEGGKAAGLKVNQGSLDYSQAHYCSKCK